MSPAPELLKRSQYFTPPNTEHPHSSRTHYFDWEEYHRPFARLHQAHLHGWGIASGLTVSVTDDGTGVEVQPGVAIDGNGELIALSPSGQADISLVGPGEAGQQLSSPFRLSTNGLANEQRYLTIQFAERLRFGEGSGGKQEQTPWLRLQPTTGDGAYVDDGSSIILALVIMDAAGVITVKTTEAGLAHGRRILATTAGTLHLRRASVTDGTVGEQLAARLEPRDEGGLRVSVPAAGDGILFQRQDGGRFAQLAVHADQTEMLGDLLVQGQLRVNGAAGFTSNVGIGTSAPNQSLTIEGATESYLNLRTPGGAQELLVGVDATGGVVSTRSNHDLHLRAGGNNPQVTLRANGNVGIGTTDPGAFKLKVEGGDTHLSGALTVMGNLTTSGILRAGALWVNATGIGIGTTTPQAKVHLEGGSLLVTGESAGVIVDEGGFKRVGFMKYAGREGGIWRLSNQDFEIGRLNAGVTALPGTPTTFTTDLYVAGNGNVGVGTRFPNGKLDVQGDIRAGNSDLYFTKTDHTHTGIGNTAGWAAIENAVNYDALMILGRSGTSKGRYVRLWDYLQVNGSMDITGNVGIGTAPGVRLHVIGNRIRLQKVGVPSHVLDMRADGSAVDLESSVDLYLNNNNVPVYYRNLNRVSSRALKEHITELADQEAMEILVGLQPVKFIYKDDANQQLHLGFIAEDVPDAIATADRKGISSMNITAVLCNIVRQHQQTIATLRTEIQTLKAEKYA